MIYMKTPNFNSTAEITTANKWAFVVTMCCLISIPLVPAKLVMIATSHTEVDRYICWIMYLII